MTPWHPGYGTCVIGRHSVQEQTVDGRVGRHHEQVVREVVARERWRRERVLQQPLVARCLKDIKRLTAAGTFDFMAPGGMLLLVSVIHWLQ